MTLTRHRLARQKIEVEKRYTEGLPPFPGDHAHLEQALLNLILNAAQAMPDGGKLTLETCYGDPGSENTTVLFRIRDTGVGIQEEKIKEIFRPFYTSRPKGLGLGLSIVMRIVKQHRGRIWVESKPGRGACFNLEFDCAGEQHG